jgi:hypothetical protein
MGLYFIPYLETSHSIENQMLVVSKGAVSNVFLNFALTLY